MEEPKYYCEWCGKYRAWDHLERAAKDHSTLLCHSCWAPLATVDVTKEKAVDLYEAPTGSKDWILIGEQ